MALVSRPEPLSYFFGLCGFVDALVVSGDSPPPVTLALQEYDVVAVYKRPSVWVVRRTNFRSLRCRHYRAFCQRLGKFDDLILMLLP